MEKLKLYRKRIIPEECILLDKDQVLYHDSEVLITRWDTIRPKENFARGFSCYFLKEGYKVSEFYTIDDQLFCWYCDIFDLEYNAVSNTYIFTDLLVDVVISPDGSMEIVDLDELADALETGIITQKLSILSLRRLNTLLAIIYKGDFPKIKKMFEPYHR